MTDDAPVNAREMNAMLPYLSRIISTDSVDARDTAMSEGIVAWGSEFVDVLSYATEEDAEQWQPIRDRGIDLYTSWLGGAQLTERADEDERRAVAAVAAAERMPGLIRLAVDALRRLPVDHPIRRARLSDAEARFREQSDADTDVDSRLMAMSSLLEQEPSAADEESLIREGEAALPNATDPAAIKAFRLSASTVLMGHLTEARDADDAATVHALSTHVRQLLDPVIESLTAEEDSYALVLAGLAAELDDDPGAALDLYVQAVGGRLSESQRETALTAILRTGVLAAREDEVLPFAKEALNTLVLKYATEPDPARAAEMREDVDRALENVAAACARAEDLDLLLWSLEMSSSARLRHRMSIRSGRSGARIRRLEAALWSAERGLGGGAEERRLDREGRAAGALTALTRLREAHRREAEQHHDSLEVPDIRAVAARIGSQDGVAVLGTGQWGTAVLLIRRPHPDEDGLEARLLQTTVGDWTQALASEDPPGWAYLLGGPWEYDAMPGADRHQALERALAAGDEVASVVSTWAGHHGLRRVWLVPHGVLGLIPWWAVGRLRDLDARYAPSLALLPRARGVAQLHGHAVVIGNATGDLPAADVEAVRVAARLHERGLAETVLSGAQCTEDEVSAALSGAKVLHFSGHATSDITESTRSALHLHPGPDWTTPQALTLLDALARDADWRQAPDGSRSSEVRLPADDGSARPGLLREEDMLGSVTIRHLEHSQTGTLQAVYADGRLVRLSELWSAGDMAVSGALRDVRLAVLSACQSGGGELSLWSDELGGLPAALLVAGVRSIVCTGWTVDDVVGAVAADLLWESLCARNDAVIDLYAVVAAVRRSLERMTRDDAQQRIDALRSSTADGRTRFRFEAAAARLTGDRPFSRPYDWATLFVIGESRVAWRTA